MKEWSVKWLLKIAEEQYRSVCFVPLHGAVLIQDDFVRKTGG